MGTFPSVELEWISKREAHRLLVKDVLRVKRFVSRVVVVPLTRNQRDALVSFAFNVGMGAFEKSTLLKKVNSGDHVAAAAQFSRWTKIQGQRSKGLLRRRNCEQHIYMKEEVESIY
jgi:lysozyme